MSRTDELSSLYPGKAVNILQDLYAEASRTDELSSLYPGKAVNILQDLYAEAETTRISEDGTLTQRALAELNPTTSEVTVGITIRDLLSDGQIEMVSTDDNEEAYEIADEGYDFVDEHLPTDELISGFRRTDLSETEIEH